MTSTTTARRGAGAMMAPQKAMRDEASDRREPPVRSDRFDGPAMIGEVLRRQASMADQQARDAWMLEALADKVARLSDAQSETFADLQAEIRDAAPSRETDEAVDALTSRIEQIAHAVAALVRGVEADRTRLQAEVAKLAESVEARAVEREKRLAEAASNKLIARSEAFVTKPTETVAAVVVKSVEDLGSALRREMDDQKAELGAMIKNAAAEVAGSAIAERFDAQERAERRRAAALSARLEAGLTEHAATLAAATERLDAMFERLDRLDARTEDLAAQTAGVEDWAGRMNEALALATSGLRDAVTEDVARAVQTKLDDEIAPRVRDAVAQDVTREMTRDVRTEVSSQVTRQVADRVKRETAAGFAPLEVELTRHADELGKLREAMTALRPLKRSAARMDALMDRLGELPLDVERAAERSVGPERTAVDLAAEMAPDFAGALPTTDDGARLVRLDTTHDMPPLPDDADDAYDHAGDERYDAAFDDRDACDDLDRAVLALERARRQPADA